MTTDKKQRIAENVLDYWYTIEFLSQDTFPQLIQEDKKKNLEAIKRVMQQKQGSQKDAKKQTEKVKDFKVLNMLTLLNCQDNIFELVKKESEKHGMSEWGNITFYVGKCKREYCIESIAASLQEKDERPELCNDEIAWFSFQLTDRGGYIENTFSLSTIIWAMNHVARKPKQLLNERLNEKIFKEEIELFEKRFKKMEEKISSNNSTDISTQDIYNVYKDIAEKYFGQLPDDKKQTFPFYCMMSYQLFKDEEAREKYADDNYLGLSMDFYSDDLRMILSEVRKGKFGRRNQMEKSIMDYIVSAYSDGYPDENILPVHNRFDLGGSATEKEKLRTFFSDTLDVRNAPIGKWPSRFMPALMQQAAVNLAINKGRGYDKHTVNRAIFSVNGPPGTGKTTLLKEIIVNHIVQRAILLAEYDEPDKAFIECNFEHGEKKNNGYSDFYSQYYKFANDKINDYSILVTSCNNAAVENITKELPDENGIVAAMAVSASDSEQMKAQLREVQDLFSVNKSKDMEELYLKDYAKKGTYQDIYFTEYAKELLDNEGAWGIISAPMGKKSNIHKFYQNVLRPLDSDYYRNDKIGEKLCSYKAIKKQFTDQKKKVETIQKELAKFCEAEKRMRSNCISLTSKISDLEQENAKRTGVINESRAEIPKQEQIINMFLKKHKEQNEKLNQILDDYNHAETAYSQVDNEYEEKLQKVIDTNRSIGFFDKLVRKKEVKIKNQLIKKYTEDAEAVKNQLESLKLKRDELKSTYEKEKECLNALSQTKQQEEEKQKILTQTALNEEEKIKKNNQEINGFEKEMKEEVEFYTELIRKEAESGDDIKSFAALNDEFMSALLSNDKEKSTGAQVSNLWFTNFYNREREKLFFFALKLHKEFIVSSRCCLKNYRNLALLWQETRVDNEKVVFHAEDREACFAPLLQTLFLLVPVISTTFASVGMFLGNIKKPNKIGTLIVDEAGQAPPQMGIGALYRSRKAVIVGDPKQVEPVVTDDLALLKKSFTEDVYKPYKSKRISVQQFADAINPYGTYLENEMNEPEWVGCPLVVHRRCISPMYDISNHMSYNGTMKQQTGLPDKNKEESFCYSGSQWINVIGKEKGKKNHYVKEQGKRVLEILEIAFTKSGNPSLFIITPFTSVKKEMIRVIEERLKKKDDSILYEKKEYIREWMYKNIGTVHTFQGKEANEVIFLLGCDNGKEAAGAVKWVNANIVNVAVTRAKYRIYFVGDERAWRNSPYISQAKKIIDTYAIEELSKIVNGLEEDTEDNQKKALAYCNKIPSAESFPVIVEENEEGELEISFSTDIYLNELSSSEILLSEVTDEQLEGYGFTREQYNELSHNVRQNIEWGIKLYSMFKKLRKNFKIEKMDFSCCAILFCKAIELHVKECFYEGLKLQLPDFKVLRDVRLKDAKKENLTLGTFQVILKKEDSKKVLAEHMKKINKKYYDEIWWDKYAEKLFTCKELRNQCCHPVEFTWEAMNKLLINLFLEDQDKREPAMKGLVIESKAGRYLL